MAYDSEHVQVELLARFRADLPAALQVVEAEWAGSDPVALPEPVTFFSGYKPTVLELDADAFPFVAVIVPLRDPQAEPSRWGYQELALTAYVDLFVVAEDEAAVNKVMHRYVQAAVAVLQAERTVYGYQQADHEPAVEIRDCIRIAREADNADLFDPEDVYFVQFARITVLLEGGNA
jgi:hypothetical protein